MWSVRRIFYIKPEVHKYKVRKKIKSSLPARRRRGVHSNQIGVYEDFGACFSGIYEGALATDDACRARPEEAVDLSFTPSSTTGLSNHPLHYDPRCFWVKRPTTAPYGYKISEA